MNDTHVFRLPRASICTISLFYVVGRRVGECRRRLVFVIFVLFEVLSCATAIVALCLITLSLASAPSGIGFSLYLLARIAEDRHHVMISLRRGLANTLATHINIICIAYIV